MRRSRLGDGFRSRLDAFDFDWGDNRDETWLLRDGGYVPSKSNDFISMASTSTRSSHSASMRRVSWPGAPISSSSKGAGRWRSSGAARSGSTFYLASLGQDDFTLYGIGGEVDEPARQAIVAASQAEYYKSALDDPSISFAPAGFTVADRAGLIAALNAGMAQDAIFYSHDYAILEVTGASGQGVAAVAGGLDEAKRAMLLRSAREQERRSQPHLRRRFPPLPPRPTPTAAGPLVRSSPQASQKAKRRTAPVAGRRIPARSPTCCSTIASGLGAPFKSEFSGLATRWTKEVGTAGALAGFATGIGQADRLRQSGMRSAKRWSKPTGNG